MASVSGESGMRLPLRGHSRAVAMVLSSTTEPLSSALILGKSTSPISMMQ